MGPFIVLAFTICAVVVELPSKQKGYRSKLFNVELVRISHFLCLFTRCRSLCRSLFLINTRIGSIRQYNMSSKHLAKGSVQPPQTEGLLRLYSMRFCPFAQRARLVLKAKEIPHEIVNINLNNKPEWYTEVNSQGKVPALVDGSQVIVESLDICDYLEEKFPQNPLYAADPETKKQDKELIQKISDVSSVFARCVFSDEQKAPEEWVKEFVGALQVFEDELANRGTLFFGGDRPRMVDYMLWPWAERAGAVGIKIGQKLPIGEQFPLLRKWRKAMREEPVCAEIYNGPEKFWQSFLLKAKGTEGDPDSID